MGFTKKILQPNDSPHSPTTKQSGDWGEQIAAQYLASHGYAIREQKWRGNHFEIDIIAQKGIRIIFVEVKMRKNSAFDPVQAVDHVKRQRMVRAADYYLRSLDAPFDYQFDIISITGEGENYTLEHVQDAFLPSPRARR